MNQIVSHPKTKNIIYPKSYKLALLKIFAQNIILIITMCGLIFFFLPQQLYEDRDHSNF